MHHKTSLKLSALEIKKQVHKNLRDTFIKTPPTDFELENRVLIDSFISKDEAEYLCRFTDEHAQIGSGYGGNAKPNKVNEIYKGYMLNNLEEMDQEKTKILKSITQSCTHLINLYFDNNDTPNINQLVKRETIVETDFTHPPMMNQGFHIDTNPKDKYIRTITSIVFLNDNFNGGHFIFQECKNAPKRIIKPKVGRLIAFTSMQNYHGVSHIYSGNRYSLNTWYTNYELA